MRPLAPLHTDRPIIGQFPVFSTLPEYSAFTLILSKIIKWYDFRKISVAMKDLELPVQEHVVEGILMPLIEMDLMAQVWILIKLIQLLGS